MFLESVEHNQSLCEQDADGAVGGRRRYARAVARETYADGPALEIQRVLQTCASSVWETTKLECL